VCCIPIDTFSFYTIIILPSLSLRYTILISDFLLSLKPLSFYEPVLLKLSVNFFNSALICEPIIFILSVYEFNSFLICESIKLIFSYNSLNTLIFSESFLLIKKLSLIISKFKIISYSFLKLERCSISLLKYISIILSLKLSPTYFIFKPCSIIIMIALNWSIVMIYWLSCMSFIKKRMSLSKR